MVYAGIVIQHKNKFLLQLRDENAQCPNMWGIFGGGVEQDETPKQAAARELEEELCVTVNENDLRLLFSLNEHEKMFIFHLYLESIENLSLGEGKEMKLFTTEEIEATENLVPLMRKFKHFLQ